MGYGVKRRRWAAMKSGIFVLVLFPSLFMFECALPAEEPVEHRVCCSIGGTAFVFDKGATDGETVPHVDGNDLYFHATTDNLTENGLSLMEGHVMAIDWGMDADAAPGKTGAFDLDIAYTDANGGVFVGVSGSIVITRYDAAGGDVEGTFSGSIAPLGGGADVAVENGSFTIKRL